MGENQGNIFKIFPFCLFKYVVLVVIFISMYQMLSCQYLYVQMVVV